MSASDVFDASCACIPLIHLPGEMYHPLYYQYLDLYRRLRMMNRVWQRYVNFSSSDWSVYTFQERQELVHRIRYHSNRIQDKLNPLEKQVGKITDTNVRMIRRKVKYVLDMLNTVLLTLGHVLST